MNIIRTSLVLVILSAGLAYAQECGPSCPVCSGLGNSAGALLSPNSIIVSGLIVPTAEEERAVFNARYGILSWLDAGVGYAERTEKILWNVRVQPLSEEDGKWKPGIILGSGSVQTGGSDQSIYVQLTKSREFGKNFGLGLSVGTATLVPEFEEVFGIAGVTTSIFERFSLFANYDGRSFHEGTSWIPLEWLALSFLMVESEFPALSVAFRL